MSPRCSARATPRTRKISASRPPPRGPRTPAWRVCSSRRWWGSRPGAAGLKRVLVPRSGIIGVGVAWTIATGTLLALRVSDATALALAPGTPAHALAVVFPAQTAFLSSLVRTTARAPRPRRAARARVRVRLVRAEPGARDRGERARGSAARHARTAPRGAGRGRDFGGRARRSGARRRRNHVGALAGAETNGAVGSRQNCSCPSAGASPCWRWRRPNGSNGSPGFRGRAASWLSGTLGGAARVSVSDSTHDGALRTRRGARRRVSFRGTRSAPPRRAPRTGAACSP